MPNDPSPGQSAPQSTPGQLSFGERVLYVIGGLMLAAAAARPRPNAALSVVALGAGSYLAWRGAEGSCPVKGMVTDLSGSASSPRLEA